MKYKYRKCILLTACVNPNGMSHTVLQDSSIRIEQYKKALDFYIRETHIPIVFCENTMYDMSDKYEEFINTGRLEYLFFDGNNYDRAKGKGYGEALIMKYAIENSNIINESKYIIKITGRIIIQDINRILSSPLFFLDNLFRSNIQEKFIATYLFIARPAIIINFVVKYQGSIREIPPKQESVEHQWYNALTKDTEFKDVKYVPFISIPQVVGVSGTTGNPYSMEDRKIWNMAYSYRFEMERGKKGLAFLYLCIYYFLYFFSKLQVKFRDKEKL